ncbi:DUF1266 domain-containing protein [Leucobacter celer]|uniref:DUF1266 domain-containing protein n=1 Tax=Leucobacter celer TaxID=668625 RepID=UPI0006A78DF4|nr:DUF1266 domain-containing protein [Leucobacter celer]
MNPITSPERLLAHTEHPVDSREANLLALGIQQLVAAGSPWNDPTASTLSEAEQQRVREDWRLHTTADLLIAAYDLVNHRHRRPQWRHLLELRVDAGRATRGAARSSARLWDRALERAGIDGNDARSFVRAVLAYEDGVGEHAFPPDEPVVSLDAYPLGQAVAVSVWGVGLGLLSQTESLRLIGYVNAIARHEFDSWEAFGRSYALGSAMVPNDGAFSRRGLRRAVAAAGIMSDALDATLDGPWAVLPWRI